MKPSFLLFHAENVNSSLDSVCHLVFVPVSDGKVGETIEFFINPEAPFEVVTSGITSGQVESFPSLRLQWPAVRGMLRRYPVVFSSAVGASARSLNATLDRLGIDFEPVHFISAKSFCRRFLASIIYDLDFLSAEYFGDCPDESDVVDIARRWAELVILAAGDMEWESLGDCIAGKVKPGVMAPSSFINSVCLRDYAGRTKPKFNPEDVLVNAQLDNPLYGAVVVFTGKLERMTRSEARTAVVSIGGVAPENVTRDTNLLVVGEQDIRIVGKDGLSGKMKKAAALREKGADIEIIGENEFLEMLGSYPRFL